jgi:hypothetical protein
MEIGKLYQFNSRFWLLYPSQQVVATAGAAEATDFELAASYADYFCRKFSCNVSYVSPSSIFMLLEENGKFCKVLTTNGEVGWIILYEWCRDDIEEVKVE